MDIVEQVRRRANCVVGVVLPTDWMRELPITAFGGKRAAELIEESDGEAVLAWLDTLTAGSFAYPKFWVPYPYVTAGPMQEILTKDRLA